MSAVPDIRIPNDLLPKDGRFGSGPSKIPPDAISALVEYAPTYLGTSHRKKTVIDVIARLRREMADLFALPDGYEVILGNGGSTAFWDVATFGLIDHRSQHCSFGEFSAKFANAVSKAPFLEAPSVKESEPGTHPLPEVEAGVDLYALTQNETSTGVRMPIARPDGTASSDSLVAVDATSAAAAMRIDASQFDCYYFAPQKALASDGGLWFALMSPAAVSRAARIASGDRYVPPSLDLSIAIENSRNDTTYNTPALVTLSLTLHQIETVLAAGGLEWAAKRCEESSDLLYQWAEKSDFATPFVTDPAKRSTTTTTIDFESAVSADTVAAVLRSNGVVDTESYRKLGRNQLRIACYPAIEPSDVEALTTCIDHVVGQLA